MLPMGSFMETMLGIGLAVSLGGPLLFVLVTRGFSINSLSIPSRMVLWLLATRSLGIAALGNGHWPACLGMARFEWLDVLGSAVGIVVMLAGSILLQTSLTKLGFKNPQGSELQKKIFSLSVPYRFFIVITAAVAEEILYRGYAIGIGREIWGSLPVAFTISLIVFVFACILAHFAVDAFGTLFVPWAAARQRARMALPTREA
jgi:membrane protease YdiL (CAAX protease family)